MGISFTTSCPRLWDPRRIVLSVNVLSKKCLLFVIFWVFQLIFKRFRQYLLFSSFCSYSFMSSLFDLWNVSDARRRRCGPFFCRQPRPACYDSTCSGNKHMTTSARNIAAHSSVKGILHQKIFYRLNLIFWIVMGCGIARFGRKGLKTTET